MIYGQAFLKSADALAFFFREAVHASCLAMLSWRHKVVMELATGVNAFVLQANRSTVGEVPLLISPSKARRLSVLRSVVGVGVSTNDDGVRIYKTGCNKTTTEADAEKVHMASYLHSGNSRMGQSLQVSLTADCSTCSARETLTVAVYTRTASDGSEFAMWLPLQDLELKF